MPRLPADQGAHAPRELRPPLLDRAGSGFRDPGRDKRENAATTRRAPIVRRMNPTPQRYGYNPRERVAALSSRAHSFLSPLRAADGGRAQLNPNAIDPQAISVLSVRQGGKLIKMHTSCKRC